jgi:hypothetical protein
MFATGEMNMKTMRRAVNMKTMRRADLIFLEAITGLTEFSCLHDSTLVEEFSSIVKIPDTGNYQNDYENVKEQIKKLANNHQQKFPNGS